MKKILILVLSSDFPPYTHLMNVSQNTWDSVQVENVETIFYCSQKDNPNFVETDKVKYFDVDNTLFHMGIKNLAMFEWALKNKDFDYVARVNASCYVDKKQLVKYVDTLPTKDVFAGVIVAAEPRWMFGGLNFVISKDVIEKIVEHKNEWDHGKMEDVSMSQLVDKIGIPFTNGTACSIDKQESDWLCLSYNADSVRFNDFSELKNTGHHYYRVKQDYDRAQDEYVMNELFKALNEPEKRLHNFSRQTIL